MKGISRLFHVLLLGIFFTGSVLAAGIAPTLVQIGGNTVSTSTSPVPSFSATPTSGHYLVCHGYETTGTLTTPAPGAGWTQSAVAGAAIAVYQVSNGTLPLTAAFTGNPTGGNDAHLYCGEFSGVGSISSSVISVLPSPTVKPSTQPLNPSGLEAEYEFTSIHIAANTPSPSPSPSPSAGPLTQGATAGNSGFYGYAAGGQYTGNTTAFKWMYVIPAFTASGILINTDLEGTSTCSTYMTLTGVGC